MKGTRISKAPEIRKQELIDTAMKVFAWRGYEETSMADIAEEMKVVAGLCYRYFSSKKELYEAAMENYAREFTKPFIEIFEDRERSFDEAVAALSDRFVLSDGHEKYHTFFHGNGNEAFHRQLEIKIIELMLPCATSMLVRMKDNGHPIEKPEELAKFILYGQMPIINDEKLTSKEKAASINAIIKKLLQ